MLLQMANCLRSFKPEISGSRRAVDFKFEISCLKPTILAGSWSRGRGLKANRVCSVLPWSVVALAI
jgi:hypothetical protein